MDVYSCWHAVGVVGRVDVLVLVLVLGLVVADVLDEEPMVVLLVLSVLPVPTVPVTPPPTVVEVEGLGR